MSNVEKNVAFIQCGSEQGNAIIIDNYHALTVKHCIEPGIDQEKEITLFYFKQDRYISQKVKIASVQDEGDGFVLLELADPVKDIVKIQLSISSPKPFYTYVTFGFDKNNQQQPIWRKLKSRGPSETIPKELISDMTFIDESKEKSVAGLSGSPILISNTSDRVIGLISQQDSEKGESIVIKGISVGSQEDFLRKMEFPFMI